MATNWRISSFNGALLAAYFIPTWTIVAFKIMVSPIHGIYERPNIAVVLFVVLKLIGLIVKFALIAAILGFIAGLILARSLRPRSP